jgi:hypothetical protein
MTTQVSERWQGYLRAAQLFPLLPELCNMIWSMAWTWPKFLSKDDKDKADRTVRKDKAERANGKKTAEADDNVIRGQVLLYVGGAVTLGALFSGLHRTQYWTVILLCDAACLAIGGLVGFLFGIPKTLQSNRAAGEKPGTPGSSEESANDKGDDFGQRVNTNLEEISDWLTKILVGLGLTELRQVPDRLQQASVYVADGIGGKPERQFAWALIVYFTVVGFLASYLLTRLFLQRAFYFADFWYKLRKTAEITVGQAAGDAVAAADITDRAVNDLKTKAAPPILKKDIATLEEFRKRLPRSRQLNIVLGRVYRRIFELDRSIDDLDRAIAVLTDFINQKDRAGEVDGDMGAALFNKACYWCLKRATEEDSQKKDELLRYALRDLTRGLQLAPELKGEAKTDEDLIPLRDLPTFIALIS